MPKPMYVWTGTAWVSVASEVESLATYATQSYADNAPGMRMIIPASVSVGSGSGSVSTQGAVTFSGASSISLNNCFNSTYDNYKIVMELTGSTTLAVAARMRVSGTDNSSANYWNNRLIAQSTNVASAGATSADTSFLQVGEYDTGISSSSLDIFSPFKTSNTSIVGLVQFRYTGFYQHSQIKSGQMTVTTSYDGITFLTSTGTITGTIRVYGYKN